LIYLTLCVVLRVDITWSCKRMIRFSNNLLPPSSEPKIVGYETGLIIGCNGGSHKSTTGVKNIRTWSGPIRIKEKYGYSTGLRHNTEIILWINVHFYRATTFPPVPWEKWNLKNMTLLRVRAFFSNRWAGRRKGKAIQKTPFRVFITTQEIKYEILMKTACKSAFWTLQVSVVSKRLKTSTRYHSPGNSTL
jgi:hypothetical protein